MGNCNSLQFEMKRICFDSFMCVCLNFEFLWHFVSLDLIFLFFLFIFAIYLTEILWKKLVSLYSIITERNYIISWRHLRFSTLWQHEQKKALLWKNGKIHSFISEVIFQRANTWENLLKLSLSNLQFQASINEEIFQKVNTCKNLLKMFLTNL